MSSMSSQSALASLMPWELLMVALGGLPVDYPTRRQSVIFAFLESSALMMLMAAIPQSAIIMF